MRIFLAGASGVIGCRLLPMLLAEGHQVTALTRSQDTAAVLEHAGAQPVVGDVYDRPALARSMTETRTGRWV